MLTAVKYIYLSANALCYHQLIANGEFRIFDKITCLNLFDIKYKRAPCIITTLHPIKEHINVYLYIKYYILITKDHCKTVYLLI